jgi:hypothetical protein
LRIRKIILGLVVALPLAACLLDLPTPQVNDDAGLDGSIADTGLQDGLVPDGPGPDGQLPDTGMDGSMGFDAAGCDSGICQVATFALEPGHIENDNTNLYFTIGSDRIESLVIASNATSTLLNAGSGEFINDLKMRNGNVYFTSIPGASNNKVVRCAKSGCGTKVTYTSGSNLAFSSVDSDGTNLVWFTIDDVSGTRGVVKCDAGAACNGVNAVQTLSGTRAIAADNSYVYWCSAGGVFQMCQAPGCASAVNANGAGAVDVTFDGNNVYWVDGSTVKMQPKGNVNGGMTIVSGGNGGANGFAVRADATNVYWLRKLNGMGELRRCSIGTGCMSQQAETLAGTLGDPTSLTLTTTDVFFTTVTPKAIWRVSK